MNIWGHNESGVTEIGVRKEPVFCCQINMSKIISSGPIISSVEWLNNDTHCTGLLWGLNYVKHEKRYKAVPGT